MTIEELEQRLRDDPHDPEALATLSPYLAAHARLAAAWGELAGILLRPVARLLDLLTNMLYYS